MKNKTWIGAAVAAAVGAAAVATIAFLAWGSGSASKVAEVVAPDAKLTVMDVTSREEDGAPAVVVTFSIPLASTRSNTESIELYEDTKPVPSDPAARSSRFVGYGEDDEDNDTHQTPLAPVTTDVSDADLKGAHRSSIKAAFSANPRLVVFTGIRPRARYFVRIKPDVKAVNGQMLTAEARYALTAPAVFPTFYFSSNGTVLPAKLNGGLPVTTLNVKQVDVQFLRIKDEQLPTFIDRVMPRSRKASRDDDTEDDNDGQPWNYYRNFKGAVNGYDLDTLHQMTESVYQARFTTEQRDNVRGVTFLPVEDIAQLQDPGVYIAVMSQPGRFKYDFQVTYFYVSDLGLQLRAFADAADVYVNSLRTGKALAGVEVSYIDASGKVLAHAATDGDGRATFPTRPKAASLVMARADRQVSMIALREPALDLSEYALTGNTYRAVKLFGYTGRDLYRPGESFDVSILARDADGKPVPAQPVAVSVKRPDGSEQFKTILQADQHLPGYYASHLSLPGDAPTGTWTVELRSDPAEKTAGTVLPLHVEEFLPERMKLDLHAPDPVPPEQGALPIDVHGTYLYGSPTDGNRVEAVALYDRLDNPLATQMPGFFFGDVREDKVHQRKQLEDLTLDAQGAGQLSVDLGPASGVQSPVRVRTTISLLESGGRPVVRNLDRVLWPAATLVGVRPLFTGDYAAEDAPVEFEVARVDQKGMAAPEADLPVKLYREDRHWYWRFDDSRGWNSGFTENEELVYTGTVSIGTTRGRLRMPVTWGRYRVEVSDPQTHLTTAYRFYAGWSAQSDETAGVRPDRVALKLDKASYRDGDTMHVEIKPPHAGEALVTVEGDRTLYVKRLAVGPNGATVSIPIDPSWTRHDLYLTAMVLRPGDAGDSVTPTRALGIEYIALDRADRKLAVTLDAPPHASPSSPVHVRIHIPQAKGHAGVVTVSAVDAGILSITNFQTPDPVAGFFGKMRYGGELRDVYGRLIERFAGQKGKLAYGGDTTPKATKSLPQKVKLIDVFSGPVLLDANGDADIPLNLPDFNGTLRLMAVAATADRFGSADSEMVVAAPIVAELATPRFLSFGDNATIALDVRNLSGHDSAVALSLSAGEGLTLHDATRRVTLRNGEKQTLRFVIDAGQKPGIIPVTVSVKSPDVTLNRDFALEVEPPFPATTVSHRFLVKPGETVDLRPTELGEYYKGSTSVDVTASAQPPLDILGALRGLLEYPYGCVEQTTSTAYPLVMVDEEAAQRYHLANFDHATRVRILSQVFGKLSALQAPDGGYSLWGGPSNEEVWLTAFVANFFQDARDKGYEIPDATLTKAKDYLFSHVQDGYGHLSGHAQAAAAQGDDSYWGNMNDVYNRHFDSLAYASYVLARDRKVPVSTLKQLAADAQFADSPLSLTYLALSFKQNGDERRAEDLALQATKKRRLNQRYWWWGEYGTSLRDSALSFALLSRNHLAGAQVADLLGRVIDEVPATGRYYYSTQEQLALFLAGEELRTTPGKAWHGHLIVGTEDRDLQGTTPAEASLGGDQLSTLKFSNAGDEVVSIQVSLHGFPLARTPNNAIWVQRDVLAADGSALPAGPLKVGDSVLVHLTVNAHDWRTNTLVVDRLPAGLEIENTNIAQGEGFKDLKVNNLVVEDEMNSSRITHLEFRDDRFVAAVHLAWWQPVHLFYRARVVTPGRFSVPGVYAEDMYVPEIYGTGTAPAPVVVTAGKVSNEAVKSDKTASP